MRKFNLRAFYTDVNGVEWSGTWCSVECRNEADALTTARYLARAAWRAFVPSFDPSRIVVMLVPRSVILAEYAEWAVNRQSA